MRETKHMVACKCKRFHSLKDLNKALFAVIDEKKKVKYTMLDHINNFVITNYDIIPPI